MNADLRVSEEKDLPLINSDNTDLKVVLCVGLGEFSATTVLKSGRGLPVAKAKRSAEGLQFR